jgi:outer membrane lipoprotein-sorting protein
MKRQAEESQLFQHRAMVSYCMARDLWKHRQQKRKIASRLVLLYGLFLCLTLFPTFHFPLATAGGPLTTAEVLEQLQAKAQTLKSFKARFEQRKFSRLLVTAMESEGRLYWQPPGRFRWEVVSPAPLTLVAQGEQVMLLYPDLKKATLYRMPLGGGILAQITGATVDPEVFQQRYQLEVTTLVQGGVNRWIKMSMIPKSRRQARYFKRLEVKIDLNTWLPEEVSIQESDKDWTMIHLFNSVENTKISDGLFKVEPPDDFQVQR